MRNKKLFGMLLCLVMLWQVCCLPAGAAVYGRFNNVDNPGFEEVDILGNPEVWKFSGGSIGNGMYMETAPEHVHDGKYALKMEKETTETMMYAGQRVKGAAGGETYTFSFWVKIVKKNTRGIAIKVEFDDGTYVQKHFDSAPIGSWSEQSFTFTLPEGESEFFFILRLWDGGEVYWDDVSVLGRFDKSLDVSLPDPVIEPAEPKLAAVSEEKELITDGDLENLTEDGTGLQDWGAYQGWSAENVIVSVSQEDPYSGENCVIIATSSGGNPWISQLVPDIEEETQYQFSMWYNTTAKQLGVKLEYYTGNEVKAGTGTDGFANSKLQYAPATDGQWQQYTATFTTPKNCKSVALYPRLYTNGIVKVDKISLYKMEQKKIKLDTDEVFYYTERETPGIATVVPNTRHHDGLADKTVSFALKDGETVLDETEPTRLGDGVKYTFPVSILAEKQKDYTLSASLYDTNGTLLETQSQTISRWDRPSRLTADGKYMVDGKEFVPTFSYSVPVADYPKMKEIGVNVVQYAMTANTKITLETLDAAHENGLMVLGCLYASMNPAGHPNQIANTKKIVEAVKDHPAVFAYVLLDEPLMQWNNDDFDNTFQTSYKTIRSIDPTRPIYLVEAMSNWQGYALTAKYCDIFTVDPYVETDELMVEEIEAHIKMAQEAVGYRKPVLGLFLVNGKEGGFYPSIEKIRYENYRAFLLGVMGTGLWKYNSSYTKADGTALKVSETPLWEDWKTFYEEEYKVIHEDFILDPKPIFNDLKTDDYYARSYVKDGKITLILLNRTTEDKTVSVPLTSGDGTLSVGNFSATVVGEETVVQGSGALEWTLPGARVDVFEITPEAQMDFSALKPSRFADLEGYSWARTQIDTLDAMGVINDKTYKSYGPGENITRGDFAYFLIRTLGLTAAASSNFADVDPDAYYAKEIAIGKELGILKGVGDNAYNPEAEISRQDLMVICSRAMELAPGTEEITFPDRALIADYAMADVAAMVRENIIKGNADGTINPLGNTTRAEAAVIMKRIDDWNKAP